MRYLISILLIAHFQLAFSQAQKNVILQDQWNDTLITLAVEDARYSDVWGFNHEGNNYCAVGSSEGVEILSVSKNELSFVDRKGGAFQGFTVVHRDMKTYQNYLYAVCDEGTSSLQIFDISYLPDSISKVYDSNALFGICHNIFIDTLKAKLYACGSNGTGMKVLDLSNPIAPTLINDFNNVGYVHDCFVVNDTAFLNCGPDGLHIYDFGPATPIQLGVLDFYADQGYNHSGWGSPDGSKYAFIDETQGTKIKLCNLSDLALIQVDQTFSTSDYQDYVPHNIFLLNKLAFVSYYNKGFRLYDISDTPIKEIAYYDTFEEETAYKLNGAWGVYVFENSNQVLICDRQSGIYLFSFPIDILEAGSAGTIQSGVPLVDENSMLILRDDMDMDGLKFSIADLTGAIVYNQENFLNWVNIPLTLSAGVYYFGIYDANGELLDSGKFGKVN